MKLKTTSLAALAAFSIAGSASATTVLLTDNFDTGSYGWDTFNNNLAADQTGTLGTVTYTLGTGGGGSEWTLQHSNGGHALLASPGWWNNGAMCSPNHNFAEDANTATLPLAIQFDLWVTDSPDNSQWIGFGLSSGQGQLFYESAYGFAPTKGDGKHNYKLVISDIAGTGSGFNGITNGAKIAFYKDNVWQQDIIETLGTTDGYMTFRTIPGAWTGYTMGNLDNLSVSLVPEPGAALLGGLGMLALLRRRR